MLARLSRNVGQRPSELAGLIEQYGANHTICLDFDIACEVRLQRFDVDEEIARQKHQAIEIANAVGIMLGGTQAGGDHGGDNAKYPTFIDPVTGEFDADAARRAGIEVV